jgi:hypothetical protein
MLPRVPRDWVRLWADEGTRGAIIGHVGDSTTGAPIRSAVVRVLAPTDRSSAAAVITTQSDKHGGFVLGRLDPGSYVLEVRAVGYEPRRLDLRLLRGKLDTFEIRMKRGAIPLAHVRTVMVPCRQPNGQLELAARPC